jgi:HlyD family secretion protein
MMVPVRNRLFLLLLAFALVVFTSIAIYSLLSPRAKTVTVTKRMHVKSVYASGYVDAVNKVTVRSEVSGYIEKIFVREGDRVEPGDKLALILNETLRENLKEVRARRELAEARLKEDSEYLRSLRENVKIRELNAQHLGGVYRRRSELFREGLIARESFDEAKRSFEVAMKELDNAKAAYEDALLSLKTELDALKAKEKSLEAELDKYVVKAPVGGEILRKTVNEGDYINHVIAQENELFSLGDRTRLETVLYVDEEFVPLLKEGQKVVVSTDAFPKETFSGRLTLIEKESDRKSRTVRAKADVSYPGAIPVGITVEANIVVSEKESIFIPAGAYRDGVVRVVLDGRIVSTPVKTGVEKDGLIEVVEGLREGEVILTE